MEEYTKYEQARIIGARALQISMGAPMLVKLTDEELKNLGFNSIEIAKLEFSKKLIPMNIKKHAHSYPDKEVLAKPFDQTKLE